MSWSYTPVATDTDRVRFLIGDTDSTDPQLQDEEIGFLLSTYGGYRWASVYAAESLAAKYSRDVDYAIGTDARESLSQRAAAYRATAATLRETAASLVFPVWGGKSLSEKLDDRRDTDAVKPIFRKDMETEPGTDAETDAGLYSDPPVPFD